LVTAILSPKQNPLDLTAVIKTPENIQFEYRLAGPFRRLPALLIDWVVRMLLIAAGYIGLLIVSSSFLNVTGQSIVQDFALLIAMVVDFLLLWFYGTFFESYWNGQTPGKWACRIRVISVDGRPVNAFQATIRNLLRPADFAPMVSLEVFSNEFPPAYIIPTFLCSLICMVLTKRFQRLGDLAAGTMVVVNERSWVPTNIKLEDARIPSLAEYIPPGFRPSATLAKALALYVERRARIPAGRRQELAAYLAKPLIRKFGFREDTSYDLLLCALYYREFMSKEAFNAKGIWPTAAMAPGASPLASTQGPSQVVPASATGPVAGVPVSTVDATQIVAARVIAPPPLPPVSS
jgi:uncharacterized RDD family membrane protein YckC